MVHYPKQSKYFLLMISLLIGIGLAGIGQYLASFRPAAVHAVADQLSTVKVSQELTLGSSALLSGEFSWLGWQQVNAVQLAISQINAAGGVMIDGVPFTLTLVTADSACDPDQAITATQQLVDAGVVAVIGPTCSDAAMPASAYLNTVGVAMVSPSATSPDITLQGYTNTFRTTPHDGSPCLVLSEFFLEHDLSRTALLIPPDPWARWLLDPFQNTYTAQGGTIVSSRIITSEQDIAPALNAILLENADVILTLDLIGEVAGQVSQVANSLEMTHTMALLTVEDAYLSEWAGLPAAERDIGAATGRRTSDMPGYKNFEAAYLDANFANEPEPGSFSPFSYDAAMIIINAIRRANSSDPGAIRDAIAATSDYAGVVGTYQGFDSYGDVIPQWSRIEVVENGVWVPMRLQAEFYPVSGGTFELGNTLGQTTTLEIPPGSSESTLELTYTLVATTNNAGDASLVMIGDHGIRLESNIAISNPVTLTIQYSDEDMYGVEEDTLTLYTWNGDQWVNAEPCGGYLRDLANNVLHVVLCHFSDYILLADRDNRVFLPLVGKD